MGSIRVWVLGSLLLSGCAYQQAMRQGDELAAAGDWVGAHEAYSRAVELNPKKTDARSAATQAGDEAVKGSLDDAEAFLELREYEKCAEQLTYVESVDDDRPEVFAIRSDLKAAIAADFEQRWEAGMHREAYGLAVLSAKIVPDAEHVQPALDRSREHFRGEAKRQLKRGEHEDALKTLRTIRELEPDRKGDVTALEHDILNAWADSLTKEAVAQARAKRLGPASVLYARAYELAGRRPDIDRSRDIAAQLHDEGRFTVRLLFTGATDRIPALKETVLKGIAGIPDAAISESSSADLTMRVSVGRQQCTEDKESAETSKEYVSGQVEKPNPVHGELTQQREQARSDEAVAAKRVAELEPELKKAEATLRDFDTRIAAAQKTVETAKSKASTAEEQLRAAQGLRDELVAQLEEMRATGGSAEGIAQWEQKLAEQGKRISEWQGVVLEHQDTMSAAQRELDGLSVERGPAAEVRDRLKSGYDAVVNDRNTAQQTFASLTTQLASTPKTIWEDVYDTFAYTIDDWTRVCTAPVSVTMQPRWDAAGEPTRSFEPSHDTEDRAHPGHEKAEVTEDPKAYPKSDEALVAEGDATTGKELVTWLNTLADDHFSKYTTNTMIALTESPSRATTDLVSLYVGAPGRLDERALSTFATHVKKHYGLEKLELLRGGATTAANQ